MGVADPLQEQEVGVAHPDEPGIDSGVVMFIAGTEITENLDTTDDDAIFDYTTVDHTHSDDITTQDGPPTEPSTFEPLNQPPPNIPPTTAEDLGININIIINNYNFSLFL